MSRGEQEALRSLVQSADRWRRGGWSVSEKMERTTASPGEPEGAGERLAEEVIASVAVQLGEKEPLIKENFLLN